MSIGRPAPFTPNRAKPRHFSQLTRLVAKWYNTRRKVIPNFMARKLYNWLRRMPISFDRCLFDFGPGERRETSQSPVYPSISESWRSDWERIGGDFRRAVSRFASEAAL